MFVGRKKVRNKNIPIIVTTDHIEQDERDKKDILNLEEKD